MPTKKMRKNPRKLKNRRKGRGRKATANKAVITHMRGAGFADSVFAKLNYVESFALTSIAVNYAPYVFRGNSCFDSNQTGTGHQPMYFDQYSAIYSKYRVLGTAVKIDAINVSGTSACYMIVDPSTEQSTITDQTILYEQGRARAPKILPVASRIAVRHKQYCSSQKAFGVSKTAVMNDDIYAALTSASPSSQWFWNILFTNADILTTVNIQFMIKIVYYVQFFDKLLGTQS